ncbi:hypothetical protein PMI11_03593 [Rhizobium sp. CF142]|nr:hypothetical protein PMI11_03593 [Rhizobium sp. CF142]
MEESYQTNAKVAVSGLVAAIENPSVPLDPKWLGGQATSVWRSALVASSCITSGRKYRR